MAGRELPRHAECLRSPAPPGRDGLAREWRDTENADLARVRAELKRDPASEQRELAGVYVGRGLDRALADQGASKLKALDATGAHARDELGLSDTMAARSTQSAWASAASISVGAPLPMAVVVMATHAQLIRWVCVASMAFLAGLGALSPKAGGARVGTGAWRVALWGAAAMDVTADAGTVFGAVA